MIELVFTCVIAPFRLQPYCIKRGVDGIFINNIDINHIRSSYCAHESRHTASINGEEFVA